MVRVSDVPHWTKSAGTTPLPIMVCLLERVCPHAYARGVCACAREEEVLIRFIQQS